MTSPDTDIEPAGEATEIQPVARANPLAIIAAMAENPACDPDKLKQLMDLQERWEDRRARGEWSEAMAGLQAACPVVPKRARGDKARFAPFEDIMAMVRPLLQEHGLAVSFSSEPAAEGALRIVCHITKGTHTESREFTCPIPTMVNPKTGKAMVNEAQRMGMALTYAKRYCLCAALNIVTAGEDFDGGPEPNPAPAADPNAEQAPSRGERSVADNLALSFWKRWEAAGGTEDTWKAALQKASDGKPVNCPSDLDPEQWGKVNVLVGELEEAGR